MNKVTAVLFIFLDGKVLLNDKNVLHFLPLLIHEFVCRVMNSTHVDWSIVYEFVFDRLRCVRQELVIQDLEPSVSVYVLERAVLFYLYSTYRYSN